MIDNDTTRKRLDDAVFGLFIGLNASSALIEGRRIVHYYLSIMAQNVDLPSAFYTLRKKEKTRLFHSCSIFVKRVKKGKIYCCVFTLTSNLCGSASHDYE